MFSTSYSIQFLIGLLFLLHSHSLCLFPVLEIFCIVCCLFPFTFFDFLIGFAALLCLPFLDIQFFPLNLESPECLSEAIVRVAVVLLGKLLLLQALDFVLLHLYACQFLRPSLVLQCLLLLPLQLQQLVPFSLDLFSNSGLLLLCLKLLPPLLLQLHLFPLALPLLLQNFLVKGFFVGFGDFFLTVAFVSGCCSSGVIELISRLHYNDSNAIIFKSTYFRNR